MQFAVWSAWAPWDRFTAVLIRSCWDYHRRVEEFRGWLVALELRGRPVFNPPPLVRWNMDKRYLLELAARGVPVPPTRLLPRGSGERLAEVFDALGAAELVVKPAVSASAHGTWRVARGEAASAQPRWAADLERHTLLAQPFLPEVQSEGEWALVFVDGALSHAVRKRPALGDFRVQHEHGGSASREEPAPGLVEVAQRALSTLDAAPLYARVDLVETPGGPLLMELELIEPALFLEPDRPGADRLAEALVRRLSQPAGAPQG